MSRQHAVPSSDRISALPDDILCRILSFLPTKHAVATCILSKRWRPLWLSVPTLDFDDQHFANHIRLPHFIFKVMLAQENHPLSSLRLKCSSLRLPPSDINAWVRSAVHRGVQTLDFHLPFMYPHGFSFEWPSCLVSCTTLTSLTLKEMSLDSLPCVDFPRLKTLRLDKVQFGSFECLRRLLSGCPVLEDLQDAIFGVSRMRQDREVWLVDSLPKLVRAHVWNSFFQLSLFSNVEFLRIRLAKLDYNDVPTFQNLTHLEFCITPFMPWNWLAAMLEHCPKLQNLVVDKLPLWFKKRDTYDDNWEAPQVVPECLSSQLRTFSFRNYGGVESELRFVGYILQNSRNLRTMAVTVLPGGCPSVGPQEMLDMLRKLSSCPRISAKCKLSLESVPRGYRSLLKEWRKDAWKRGVVDTRVSSSST